MEICMIVVQGKQKGKHLRFPEGEFLIGRGPECHVRPESPSVSRQHCLLRITRDAVFIRDLGSTNGTLINGARLVDEVRLNVGDLVQLGPLVLEHSAEVPAATGIWQNQPPNSACTDEYSM